MLHGAAHGPGVYTALSSNLAATYCGYNSLAQWKCITLCEVALCPENNRKNPSMVVVPDASAVSLRFLLLYTATQCIPDVAAESLRTHAAVQELELARSKL